MLANRSIPEYTVIPELAYPDIEKAIEWLTEAFGFTVRVRIAGHRAQMNVGDGAIVLTEGHENVTDTAHSALVRVENVNQHSERARKSGAKIVREPADHPYGERQYTAEDLAGHRWTFSQSIADVAPEDEEWGGTSGQL
jgi:uncharacterized glyoxalase superfamily protein PhnB